MNVGINYDDDIDNTNTSGRIEEVEVEVEKLSNNGTKNLT